MKCIRCNCLVHFDSELLIAIYTHSAGRLYTFIMEDFSQLFRDFLNCLEKILSAYHAVQCNGIQWLWSRDAWGSTGRHPGDLISSYHDEGSAMREMLDPHLPLPPAEVSGAVSTVVKISLRCVVQRCSTYPLSCVPSSNWLQMFVHS